MKKLITVMALLASALTISAQSKEPEFVGEVALVNGDSTTLLDKEYLKTNTSVDASLVLFGLGSARTRVEVSKRNSQVRVNEGEAFRLIAKAKDNLSDPMSVIRVFQFAMYHNSRKAEVSSADVFSGVSGNKLNNITYKAVKYGSSSYDLAFNGLAAGEYGVIVFNPNQRDSRATIVYCFGVGHPKKHSGWEKHGSDGVYN